MSLNPDNHGCQLPEALRRYYLDAMGIQLWIQSVPDATPAMQEVATKVAAVVAVPVDSKNSQTVQWHALQADVAACTKCELHSSRTQTVFGVGNHNADVLVIGEAPGQDEDAQGEPFVGRAGKLLDAMLQAINLQREQVYIANILKCRPPGNRDPHADEVAQCRPYLQQQIELLQPKVIFAVGRVAAQSLLQSDDAVGKLRGRVHDFQGIPLLVSYHPAYLLRKPTEKRKAWQDLLRLRAVLN
ncbi:MAG: uracil-DNA glycosylase [Gammaproteobacteria bacterium]